MHLLVSGSGPPGSKGKLSDVRSDAREQLLYIVQICVLVLAWRKEENWVTIIATTQHHSSKQQSVRNGPENWTGKHEHIVFNADLTPCLAALLYVWWRGGRYCTTVDGHQKFGSTANGETATLLFGWNKQTIHDNKLDVHVETGNIYGWM